MRKKIVMTAALLLVASLLLSACAPATPEPKAPSELILAVDMVRGAGGAPKGAACVMNSQFQRGELVVFRARVFDPATANELPAVASELLARAIPPEGEELGAMAQGLEVVVHLADGQSFPMRFGDHPGRGRPAADYFWTASWVIPEDYPTGTIKSWVTADWSAESKAGRWDPFNSFPALLTVME